MAKIAQKLSQTCELKHDKIRNTYGESTTASTTLNFAFFSDFFCVLWLVYVISAYGTIVCGQNIARTCDVKSAIDKWYKERDNFALGTGSKNGKEVGHYTQVIKKSTTLFISYVCCVMLSVTVLSTLKSFNRPYANLWGFGIVDMLVVHKSLFIYRNACVMSNSQVLFSMFQMVQSKALKIGCGRTKIEGGACIFVCNYAYGQWVSLITLILYFLSHCINL